ncbi:MAG: hypothetical protein Q9166_003074 [cf. Caloplaca sp. 2 TL-2023]
MASPRVKTNIVKPKPSSFLAQLGKKTALVRSVPSSPAVAPARRPVVRHSSWTLSAREKIDLMEKMEALKIPLLHLVAIRPMSLKFLANKVACSQEECKQILEKHGKPARLDPDKWDLTDKAFKELDVWEFQYELDDDRELAIEHAVSAYDRMRLSREDRLWQMLLPKEERGKGKILSKLQLHQGPIQKISTPTIHVQGTADDQVNDDPANAEDEEEGHLTPADAATAMTRSQSSDQAKKKRVNDHEAQSKRLLSSGPKKATATAKAKDMAKRKTTKKGAPGATNAKSAEFVHDSDEDEDEAIGIPATTSLKSAITKTTEATLKTLPKSQPGKPAPPIKESQSSEKITKGAKPSDDSMRQTSNGSNNSPSTIGTPASKHRPSDASQSSSSGSKLSRQRTTSSPHKPSPLGSSPPTNASDLDNDSQLQLTSTSSTSSTPLVAQGRTAANSLKPRPDASKRLPDTAEQSSQPSLKRKADDKVSDSHANYLPLTNGHITATAKRVKTSVPSPPPMDSSSSESSPISDNVMAQAQRFKDFYTKYDRLYQELSTQANAAPEKIDQLVKMHERLRSMKDGISRAVVYK